MAKFFDFFRTPTDRRASELEMEGFDPEPPEPPKTEYALDQPILMPDMPDLDQRRTKLADELEGADRGVSLTCDLEPGTEIPAQRAAELNRKGAEERQAKLVKRIAEMKEQALKKALAMDLQAQADYLEGLEGQVQDAQERAAGLRDDGQLELAAVEEDEAKVLHAQADIVREFLQAKRKAQ